MKRRMYAIITLITLIASLSGCQISRPRQALVMAVLSPDGNHELRIYENNGGATVDWSITASVLNIATTSEHNILFIYHLHHISNAIWIDNETVMIDEHTISINEYKEIFDGNVSSQ